MVVVVGEAIGLRLLGSRALGQLAWSFGSEGSTYALGKVTLLLRFRARSIPKACIDLQCIFWEFPPNNMVRLTYRRMLLQLHDRDLYWVP